jgi:hypothetical protein
MEYTSIVSRLLPSTFRTVCGELFSLPDSTFNFDLKLEFDTAVNATPVIWECIVIGHNVLVLGDPEILEIFAGV